MNQDEEPQTEAVAAYVAARAGVAVSGPRHDELMARVAEAMAAAGTSSAERFCRLLEEDAARFDELVVALTVGESYFFRDAAQMELLRRQVLPERAGARGAEGVLRLWSAGCASGQEPYTLAILLAEEGLGGRARILATDLSRAALEAARAGVFGRWSLRAVDDHRRRTWFSPVGTGYRVDPTLDRMVEFEQHNLLEAAERPRTADMDVVVCRNVLVYLTPEAIQQVGRRLVAALAPGGWLLTASTDPHLEGVEGLETVVTPAGVAYRRLAGAPKAQSRPPAPRPPAPGPPARERPRPARRATAARVDRSSPAPRPPAPAAGGGGTTAEAHVEAVRALGSAGDLGAAAAAAATGVAEFPMHVELRLLQAIVLLESGLPQGAAAAARAALYIDPDLAMAHLTLARAEQARGDGAAAARSYRNALVLLEAAPVDEPVRFAGGDTAGRLAGLARAGAGVLHESARAARS